MNSGKTIFAQLMDFLPTYEFRKCVEQYEGNYKIKSFSCWDQFLCLAFAQLTYRESLRDIEACLRVAQTKLYHLGFRSQVSRNTLANANQVRDWRIYADFAQVLIHIARSLYANEDFGLELDQTVYALDSTTIDLCLALFPWAKFRKRKGAVKLHTLLDLRGSIPSVIFITHGKVHDIQILDHLWKEPGAIYLMNSVQDATKSGNQDQITTAQNALQQAMTQFQTDLSSLQQVNATNQSQSQGHHHHHHHQVNAANSSSTTNNLLSNLVAALEYGSSGQSQSTASGVSLNITT